MSTTVICAGCRMKPCVCGNCAGCNTDPCTCDEIVDLDEAIREAAEARWGPDGVAIYHRRKVFIKAVGIDFNEYDRYMDYCHVHALAALAKTKS